MLCAAHRLSPLMRIRISHLTSYRYETPATSVIQMLRLTPRNHDGQYVARWRIDVSTDCRLDQHEDAFGNITHVFTAEGPFSELAVAVEGEVETRDTQGVVRGVVERFPPSFNLRTTALTTPDSNIAGFAAARSLGVPARYVGGYFRRDDEASEQEADHAWAEAFVPALGWVAFDAANGLCATDAHVRVAVGLDDLGAAPLRGTRYGGVGEALSVKVRVEQAAQQTQN